MIIRFDVTEETTITNTTVKITAWITGVIGGQDRETLEGKSLELARKLFPDAKWAFSNWTYQPDGFTFRVQATCRIDSSQNDQLDVKTAEISEKGALTIQISNIDASIPLFETRKAESDLRVALIARATEEATKLGGVLSRVVFNNAFSQSLSNSSSKNATYAAAAFNLEAAGGAPQLGHSEKILLSAEITVSVKATEA